MLTVFNLIICAMYFQPNVPLKQDVANFLSKCNEYKMDLYPELDTHIHLSEIKTTQEFKQIYSV